MKKYVLYLRVSTQGQGESGLGLEAQQRDIDLFLQNYSEEPYEVIQTFTDVASGAKNRPMLQDALRCAKLCNAELVVQKLDRLGRTMVDLAPLLVKNAKPTIRVAQLPYADTFQLHIYAALAEQEREFISQRTKAALQAAKARGVKLGGHRPQQDKHVKEIKELADASANKVASIIVPMREGGSTLQEIANAINAASIPTPRGKSWTPTAVRNALKRLGHIPA